MFTMLSILIHEQGMSLQIFRSYLILLIRIGNFYHTNPPQVFLKCIAKHFFSFSFFFTDCKNDTTL